LARRTALGAYLPSVTVNAATTVASARRFNPQTNTTDEGSVGSHNAGVSAAWDLFTGFRRSAIRASSAAQADAASSQLLSDRAQVALLVQRAFFDELRAEALVGVATARIDRARQGLDAAQRRFQAGSATRSDVLRAQLELNTARQQLLDAETQRTIARFVLGRLVGADGEVDAVGEPPLPQPAAAEDEAHVEQLVLQGPASLAAEAAVRAAGAGIDAARARYWPTLRLSTGYDTFNPGFVPTSPVGSWQVRLGLSFTIFDGFVREEAVERAYVQQRVAVTQLADTRRAVRSEAQRARGQVRLAAEQIALAQQAVEVAGEDLRVQQERYRLGVSTILDLLQSQTSLVQVESDLVTARFNYQLARAELEALAGRPL
ncbi:MAG: TolC family protein, partial [Myxococcales bacterium]